SDSFTYTITDGQSNTATATVTIDVTGVNDAPVAVGDMRGPAILRRHVFYNNSALDRQNPQLNASDDFAIAVDKNPLLPGQPATVLNYTSYHRGLNGLMIDIKDLTDSVNLSVSDLEFHVSDIDAAVNWVAAPAPLAMSLRLNDGVDNAHRVSFRWA